MTHEDPQSQSQFGERSKAVRFQQEATSTYPITHYPTHKKEDDHRNGAGREDVPDVTHRSVSQHRKRDRNGCHAGADLGRCLSQEEESKVSFP
jgi:hypothetical protein